MYAQQNGKQIFVDHLESTIGALVYFEEEVGKLFGYVNHNTMVNNGQSPQSVISRSFSIARNLLGHMVNDGKNGRNLADSEWNMVMSSVLKIQEQLASFGFPNSVSMGLSSILDSLTYVRQQLHTSTMDATPFSFTRPQSQQYWAKPRGQTQAQPDAKFDPLGNSYGFEKNRGNQMHQFQQMQERAAADFERHMENMQEQHRGMNEQAQRQWNKAAEWTANNSVFGVAPTFNAPLYGQQTQAPWESSTPMSEPSFPEATNRKLGFLNRSCAKDFIPELEALEIKIATEKPSDEVFAIETLDNALSDGDIGTGSLWAMREKYAVLFENFTGGYFYQTNGTPYLLSNAIHHCRDLFWSDKISWSVPDVDESHALFREFMSCYAGVVNQLTVDANGAIEPSSYSQMVKEMNERLSPSDLAAVVVSEYIVSSILMRDYILYSVLDINSRYSKACFDEQLGLRLFVKMLKETRHHYPAD